VDAAPESGAQCLNSTDDDGDGKVNDGCPQVGAAPEAGAQCNNATDDDAADDAAENADVYEVTATNMSGLALVDVFVVADTGTDFGNWDGNIDGSHAKKIADVWGNGGVITFRLMNVAPNVPPNFDSIGVNSPGGPSNFSIVARREGFDGGCNHFKPDAPPCDETTHSLGKYRIYISPKFRYLFAGYPGYQGMDCPPGTRNAGTTFQLDSPCLSDPATVLGRSAPHLHGSALDTIGTPVGDAGTLVKDSDFTVLPDPNFQGPNGSREIHTEIVQMSLSYGGASVRVGSLAPLRPKSFGEVESKSSSGFPANDFPADSFFDVFVEVDLPPFALFPGGTVYNPQALLVLNNSVTDLPPTVVYVHGNSSFVQVRFKTTVPGKWVAGDLLGWLTLAGHGVGTTCEHPEQVPTGYCAATEMEGIGGCCLPDATCERLDQDGCNDAWGGTAGTHYLGDHTLCNKCGACCLPANGCVPEPKWEFECHAMSGGHFEGSGTTSCTHNPDGSCTTGACCRPNNVCTLDTTSDECAKFGGRFEGYGSTTCAHNAAGDCIPTVTEWGLVVMAMLVLTAGTVVVMRRRAIVRGGL
jgi:hypothetical protein